MDIKKMIVATGLAASVSVIVPALAQSLDYSGSPGAGDLSTSDMSSEDVFSSLMISSEAITSPAGLDSGPGGTVSSPETTGAGASPGTLPGLPAAGGGGMGGLL